MARDTILPIHSILTVYNAISLLHLVCDMAMTHVCLQLAPPHLQGWMGWGRSALLTFIFYPSGIGLVRKVQSRETTDIIGSLWKSVNHRYCVCPLSFMMLALGSNCTALLRNADPTTLHCGAGVLCHGMPVYNPVVTFVGLVRLATSRAVCRRRWNCAIVEVVDLDVLIGVGATGPNVVIEKC